MTKAGKISLLLADVDGTLVTHDKILTERAKTPCSACASRVSGSLSPAAGLRRGWRC